MAKVVERVSVTVEHGFVKYDDREVSYERAEEIIGRRLDRRKNYGIIKGEVCEVVSWSECCSGCCEGPEYGCDGVRGGGCSECGNTGRNRRSMYVPIIDAEEVA